MTYRRATFWLYALLLCLPPPLIAQLAPGRTIELRGGMGEMDLNTGQLIYSNVVATFEQEGKRAFLTADKAVLNQESGEVVADGRVRILQDDQIWAGEHIVYNFKSRKMISSEFRTGKSPVFAGGSGLSGDVSNQVYTATNAFITTDDVARPAIRIRAKSIRIISGERIEATHATLLLGSVPVFYFPFYSRRFDAAGNHFNFTPGYRSQFGPFLLSTYDWVLDEHLRGAVHMDFRQQRGIGVGPDFAYNLGRWGTGLLSYYYTHDDAPRTNAALNDVLFENRQRLYFSYQSEPFTNFTVKSLLRYQNDIGVLHDFFESEYRQNPQPNTFIETRKFWDNFSLNILAQPRVNDFYETVERLPDVRLTGFRQQLGPTPFYYESESSVGYYERLFAETNSAPPGLDYAATRADTYHQITAPFTLFGWLNIAPRAGGRFTYYSESSGPGADTEDAYRGVFNTGAEVNFKASRLWPGVHSRALNLDGLRHIVQPSVNYVYVPRPDDRPFELPQFDYELPSLRLLPIEFPLYNNIDSIDSENTIRFGLANKLQTKRRGQVEDLLRWEIFTDWRLRPRTNQSTFSDVYSDLTVRPRSWLSLDSQIRYDIHDEQLRMSLHTMTLRPNNVWSWTLGHFYLRDDFSDSPIALGQGNDLITSTLFYRMNENWGFRAAHHYDIKNERLQEQYYTVYRDLRSWTAAVTAGLRDNGGAKDFIVTFTFSLKAAPRYALGSDTVRPHSLLGR